VQGSRTHVGWAGSSGSRFREYRALEAGDMEPASWDLLDAITRSEEDRAALIGRLYVRDDATWLALLLTDIGTDEMLRLQIVEAQSLVLAS
jgi:hypothetical protein